MNILWSIPYPIATSPPYNLGIFIDGGINNIEIAFTVGAYCPFAAILKVIVHVGSNQIIMQSITHNLPHVNRKISF